MDEPTLTLTVDSLCSKWGFNDGDEPETLLDYWDVIGFDYNHATFDWDDVLRRLVRTHLVPAIEAAGHTVEVYDISTIHNPIRAARIDGQEIDDRAETEPFDLEVTVPYAKIMVAVDEVAHRR